jgi:hypothetical protein
MQQNKYTGMWVTADGNIRHELLVGGRYDEARGKRKSAYQGNYTISGDHIEYATIPDLLRMAISGMASCTTRAWSCIVSSLRDRSRRDKRNERRSRRGMA